MKRIVFCTELGGNYGHISGFIPLSEALQAQGYELVFILRSLKFAALLGPNATCLQAPIPYFVPVAGDTYGYADLLAQIGYVNEPVLTRYIAAWRDMFLNLRADLIIADHAPTALLAAQVLTLPAAAIGTGFVIPPVHSEFPLYSSNEVAPPKNQNAAVFNTINAALRHLSAKPLDHIGDIFARTNAFLCTFPELDHYGQRPQADYWGPLFSDQMGDGFVWPSAAEHKIFAYLTPRMSSLTQALSAIAQLPGFKLLHVPDISDAQAQAYQRSDVRILTSAVNMQAVLAEVDMIISHGGAGISSLCALAGVRHVMIPTQMEQQMLTRRMVAQGLAYGVAANELAPAYAEVFDRAMNCALLAQNKHLLQQAYAGFSQTEQIEVMTEELISALD